MKRLAMILLVLTIPFIQMHCGRRAAMSEVEQPRKSFEEFKKVLPKTILPLTLVCGLQNGTVSLDDFHEYYKYLPKSVDKVAGIVGDEHYGNTLILYGSTGDDIYPHLFSYDKNGIMLDSISLILSPCGGADETQIPITYASIDKDLHITLTDTIKFIHYSSTESIQAYVIDSLRTSVVRYDVNGKGRFVKK